MNFMFNLKSIPMFSQYQESNIDFTLKIKRKQEEEINEKIEEKEKHKNRHRAQNQGLGNEIHPRCYLVQVNSRISL